MEQTSDYERQLWRLGFRLECLLEPRYIEHARTVIARFKEITEGIKTAGDDSPLPDVWEDFKDQVQGQESIYFDDFVQQFRDLAESHVDDLASHEVELLWLGTEAFGEAEGPLGEGFDRHQVVDELCRHIHQIAANEEIRYVGTGGEAEIGEAEVDEGDCDETDGGESEESVSREEARLIAEEHLINAIGKSATVADVLTAEETLRLPSLYGVDLDQCWIAYLKRAPSGEGGPRSSEIVAVSMLTGDVVYAGSAHDEG